MCPLTPDGEANCCLNEPGTGGFCGAGSGIIGANDTDLRGGSSRFFASRDCKIGYSAAAGSMGLKPGEPLGLGSRAAVAAWEMRRRAVGLRPRAGGNMPGVGAISTRGKGSRACKGLGRW